MYHYIYIEYIESIESIVTLYSDTIYVTLYSVYALGGYRIIIINIINMSHNVYPHLLPS